jgi:hypothetical protein
MGGLGRLAVAGVVWCPKSRAQPRMPEEDALTRRQPVVDGGGAGVEVGQLDLLVSKRDPFALITLCGAVHSVATILDLNDARVGKDDLVVRLHRTARASEIANLLHRQSMSGFDPGQCGLNELEAFLRGCFSSSPCLELQLKDAR